MITRNFNLNLYAGHSIPLVINANQYDHGEQWLFKLFNSDGTQYVPSSGAIVGIKSDNLGIINTGSVDDQGRVVINETQQMTAAVGKAVFELVIDDGTHGTANFVVLVEPKPGDNADLSETDISMIEQAVEAASTIKPYGSPLVASTVAGMTDHEKVYVYVGSETGYTSGNWYYWDGSAWTSGGVYNSVAVQTDTTLTLSGVAADSKKVGDEISDLKSEISSLSSIPATVKVAMDTLFEKSAYIDETATSAYATFHAWVTAISVLSITAVFEQGANVIYDTDSLDDLKQYLTVTASFDDGTSGSVESYTLSGILNEGTSTITVAYGGQTDTFTVNVTSKPDIPDTFNLVSYITASQSGGNQNKTPQYISIPEIASDTTKQYRIETSIKWSANPVNTTQCMGLNAFGFFANTSNEYFVDAVNTHAIASTSDFDEIVMNINPTTMNNTLTVNGTTYNSQRSKVTEGVYLKLFGLDAYNNGHATYFPSACSMQYWNFYINDNLTLKMLPVVRKSDGKAGMYDLVESKFYPSNGTADFTYTE